MMVCTEGNTNRECSFFWVGWWALMVGREQKVGWQGCEGFRPIVGHRVGESQKCVFRLFPHSRPRWHALRATHIPRRPKKKPLRGKKVGFAEKKLRLSQTVGHRVYQGRYIPAGWIHATTDPPRLMALAAAGSKLRSPAPRLHGVCSEIISVRGLT